jgi:CBS domain containing-hemolysin-like protein
MTDADKQALYDLAKQHQPVYVSDTIDNLHLIKLLKNSKGNLAIVIDEFGQVSGLVTPLDLFEAIAGEFPDEDESPEITQHDNHWLVDANLTHKIWNSYCCGATWYICVILSWNPISHCVINMPRIANHLYKALLRF